MPRNLRDDFRMYYNSTYVSRVVDGARWVMQVGEVTYRNEGYTTADILLHGRQIRCDHNGEDSEHAVWSADTIDSMQPHAGYYRLASNRTPVYIEFSPQNRTNRKGFEPSRAIVNGQAANLSIKQVAKMYGNSDFTGKVFIDLCLHKSRLLWRGLDVGSFHDGSLELDENYRFLDEYATKQLNRFTSNGG